MCALDVSSEQVFSSTHFFEGSSTAYNLSSPALSGINIYTITHRQATESAWIFLINDNSTQKPMVAKVLRPYHDLRYNLFDVAERQRCQLEAFQHNRNFTPEVYLGLAKVYNQPSEEDYLLLGAIIQHPSLAELEQNAEYALIMERLPDDWRLDQLLGGDESSVQQTAARSPRALAPGRNGRVR
jgi:aminoglycoside phosphotransferase family enzyme